LSVTIGGQPALNRFIVVKLAHNGLRIGDGRDLCNQSFLLERIYEKGQKYN